MVRRLVGLALLAAVHGPPGLSAQAAGTLPLLDPAYEQLARLEAAGLVPNGWTAQRPYSVARVRRMVADAEGWLAVRGADVGGREDLEAVLEHLRARFLARAVDGTPVGERAMLTVDVEAGGGDSPGRGYTDNGTGEIDAVANPLWAYRGGRAYGDRATAAAAGVATVPVGTRFAFGLGARGAWTDATGLATGRDDVSIEAAYVRGTVGRYAVQVGRDAWSWGLGGRSGLALSAHGSPVDLVRLSTDRPWDFPLLGETDLTLAAADLGPNQNFPHAKLFSGKLSVRPTDALQLGVVLINKQMGEDAPSASTAERLKDLSFVVDLFRKGVDYVFSEKLFGLDVRITAPEASGFELHGEVLLTDIGADRFGDNLEADGAFRLSARWARLGATGRHSIQIDGTRVGPRIYRHHQFTSGLTVDRFVLGPELGPDGRSVAVEYGYHPASAGWDATVTMSIDDRSQDGWVDIFNPALDFQRDPAADGPNELRMRVQGSALRWLRGGTAGIELSGGFEAVRNFAFAAGQDRTNLAFLVRGWLTL